MPRAATIVFEYFFMTVTSEFTSKITIVWYIFKRFPSGLPLVTNCQSGADGTAFDFFPVPPGMPGEKEINIKLNTNIMIRPLADRVLIEPKEAETKTASGIYIPDTAKEKPQQGKVIAVGPGKKDEPMEVKVGEEVLYGKYAGTEVTVEDKKYLIVKQSDILSVL